MKLGQLQGTLELTCSIDQWKRSFLSRQRFSIPFHISKSYWTGQVLLVNVVNPTAGLFAGDQLSSNVIVEPGASLLLTTPSASRAHTMPSGRALFRQSFTVQNGSWLEVVPEFLIPQEGCDYQQETILIAEPSSSFFHAELLAPGRVASGETFAFRRLGFDFSLVLSGKLTVKESYSLVPGHPVLKVLTSKFANPYLGTVFLYFHGKPVPEHCLQAIHDLQTENVLCGISEIESSAYAIRMVASSAILIRETLRRLRAICSKQRPELTESSRKL
jgi:urease accessory protein